MGRRFIALLGFSLLAGCGFQPMYGSLSPNTQAGIELENIELSIPNTRLGALLHNQLADTIYSQGAPAEPAHQLAIQIDSFERSTALRIDASTAREIFELQTRFQLTDIESGEVVYTGARTTTASYDVVDSQFSTLVSKEDAQTRAVRQMSDDIKLDLGWHFSQLTE